MSTNYDLLGTFAEHETFVLTVTARTRAGTILADPASATVTMVVSADGGRDVPVFEMVGAPQVIHLGASVFQLRPSEENLALLQPGRVYYYDVWSIDGTNGRLHQVDGALRLKAAAREA